MDFAKAIAAEKNRIHSAITDLSKEKSEIDNKISKLQLELDAITAYENTKSGKPVVKPVEQVLEHRCSHLSNQSPVRAQK